TFQDVPPVGVGAVVTRASGKSRRFSAVLFDIQGGSMSIRSKMLRARLTGAANKTLSVLYRKSATRRAVAAWEALEERILFGYTPGYNQTPIPTAPCTGPICQCPTPVTGGNGGPGSGAGGSGAGAGMGGGGGGPGGPSANGPGGGPSSDGLHND